VSIKVREQYEDSPYPRWVNLGLSPNGMLISKMVAQSKIKLFDNEICNVSSPDILVAGCGTGQHAIGTAARFRNSKVLAIDLSLSSLAYAKRKTEELGVLNIEYMQADILDLGKLNRQFNVIESAGVLHHMEQPMAGWKVLVDCLKVGGLMNIGLYSELARQHIVEMRKEISQSGIGSSDAVMKSFRSGVIASDEEHHNLLDNSKDFYSLSTLRDLLFHVQEHRFTVPQIKDCLSDLGLKFCGFEGAQIVQNFRLNHTEADDPYDLDKWQKYEEANPHTFAGMYQFWCQKLA
jgi:ubiquinone/menaquinone biosynthesis C-methylase UbiE